MVARRWIVIVVVVVLIIVASNFLTYYLTGARTTTTTSVTTVTNSSSLFCVYQVSTNGTLYIANSCANGVIVYEGSNATLAIQDSLNNMTAGGTLAISIGRYAISGSIFLPPGRNSINIVGSSIGYLHGICYTNACYNGTMLYSTGRSPVFVFNAPSSAIFFDSISDLGIWCCLGGPLYRTAGISFEAGHLSDIRLNDLFILDFNHGIEFETRIGEIFNIFMNQNELEGNNIGFFAQQEPGYTSYEPIFQIFMSEDYFSLNGEAMHLENVVPYVGSPGSSATKFTVNDTMFQLSGNDGVVLSNSSDLLFTGDSFINSGYKSSSFHLGAASGNGYYSGLAIVNGSTNITIVSSAIGNPNSSGNQSIGIYLSTSTSNILVSDNQFWNNSYAQVYGYFSPKDIFANNMGYNATS